MSEVQGVGANEEVLVAIQQGDAARLRALLAEDASAARARE
jgi:hypothetical protein